MNPIVVCVVCSSYLSATVDALKKAGVARSGISVLAHRTESSGTDPDAPSPLDPVSAFEKGPFDVIVPGSDLPQTRETRVTRETKDRQGVPAVRRGGALARMLGLPAAVAARLEAQLAVGRCLLVVHGKNPEQQGMVVDVLKRFTPAFDIQSAARESLPEGLQSAPRAVMPEGSRGAASV